ncbi:MAG: PqqD family protein [Bacteroidia bacterium]|nr:MAG: PqqD family protein [Bacteroidia bacterium]
MRYIRNNSTVSGRLHDELVMMDIEKGKYFSLNPVATRIWDLLEKPMTEEEVCLILIDEYDVNQEQCRSEVNELLNELSDLGLVKAEE